MFDLRPYQIDLANKVRHAWAGGARNVLMRLDTGGGKTVILGDLHQKHPGASAVIAHRQELVSQLSVALGRVGVQHNLIASQPVRRAIAAGHMAEFGRCYYNPGAKCAVASVDTLIRAEGLEPWARQVTFWTTDEGHHVVEGNKWHRALELFTHPEVKGLLPTATPARADGKGLGRHADGVADAMVEGPPMRWLIEQGFLTDYRMVCVETQLQLLEENIGASGDWSTAQLREADKKSTIVGDTIAEYKKWAMGRLCVTFTSNTETAVEITRAFQAAGIRAATLTGETDDGLRRQMLRQFAARELEQLVVVDIVSEGFDMPAIQCAIFDRKTASLATYMQQFGRALRPMYAPGYDLNTAPGRLAAIAAGPKPMALIIDKVGNFLRHGPPDRPRPWTLDRRDRKSRQSGGIPLRVCLECFQPSERTEICCRWCGADWPEPASRSSPQAVDGDLTELDPATLAALRGAVDEADMHPDFYRVKLAAANMPPIGIMANVKRFADRQDAQVHLRDVMDLWAGRLHARGRSDRQIQREFFHTWGLDVLSAMALGAEDADKLRNRIEEALR